ncbi:MAG: hypothetical protein Q8Q12_16870 [bacterium]|nr:hypothetical protein [bacterium]
MAYPSVKEFEKALFAMPLEDVVKNYVFEGKPFAFRGRPRALAILRRHLHARLSVADENVVVIGSGKIGFSLNPHTYGRRFSEFSDIDVVVVDGRLFDKVWLAMLEWNYPRSGPRRARLYGADLKWATDRKEELYWGWFVPDRIRYTGLSLPDVLRPLRDMSTAWFNAFQSVSRYQEFAGRNVSGRLYRTWEHALLYHIDGLRQIVRDIERAKEGEGCDEIHLNGSDNKLV